MVLWSPCVTVRFGFKTANRAGLRCLVSVEVAQETKPYYDFAMEQSLLNGSHEKGKAGFKISFIFIFAMG